MFTYSKIFLKPKEEKEILQGYPWVYDNEISNVKYNAADGSGVKTCTYEECIENNGIKDGEVVEVYTKAGGFVGTGVINKQSKITVRIISKTLTAEQIMEDPESFWFKAVSNAVNIRRLNFEEKDSYRLIFAEADFIPGLIVERYVSSTNSGSKVILFVQFLALACEVFRKEILAALEKICSPDGIYERSDEGVRQKEGLEVVVGWIGKKPSGVNEGDLQIEENGIKLSVDIEKGQKTGYFLDQKFNREEIKKYVHGKRVLDTFTHTGAFGLNAVKGGAKEVVSVDISPEAVEIINRNIELNGATGKMTAVCKDVFDLLKEYETAGEKFDVIILDPPAFTKSAKSITKAYGGYKEINLRAMRLLNEGGILVTCSCSHYFDPDTFYEMIMHAAKDSHKRVQVLEKRGAGPDHPVLLGYPKSEYLKCAICRVL